MCSLLSKYFVVYFFFFVHFHLGNFKQAFNENNIIAGMSLKNSSLLTSTPLFKSQGSGIGYPEVTLHPIQSTILQNQKHVNDNMSDAHANSLLHGILTKVCFTVFTHIDYIES